MHQRKRREVREVDGLLAAERRAAAAAIVFVVDIAMAAVAVEGDDDRRAERDRRRALDQQRVVIKKRSVSFDVLYLLCCVLRCRFLRRFRAGGCVELEVMVPS